MEPQEDDLTVVEDYRRQFVSIGVMYELLGRLEQFVRQSVDLTPITGSGLDERLLLSVAARPKTTAAIVGKLARERTRLSQMQDIVGGRIVVPYSDLQDEVRDALVDASGERLLRVTDTRMNGDRNGYPQYMSSSNLPAHQRRYRFGRPRSSSGRSSSSALTSTSAGT